MTGKKPGRKGTGTKWHRFNLLLRPDEYRVARKVERLSRGRVSMAEAIRRAFREKHGLD